MSVIQGNNGSRYNNSLNSGGAATSQAARSNDVMLLLGPLMAGASNNEDHHCTSPIIANDHDDMNEHSSVICTSSVPVEQQQLVLPNRTATITYDTVSTTCPNAPVLSASNEVAESYVANHLEAELLSEEHHKNDILTRSLDVSNALTSDDNRDIDDAPVLNLSSNDSHIFAADVVPINLADMAVYGLGAPDHDSSNSDFISTNDESSHIRDVGDPPLLMTTPSSYCHSDELSCSLGEYSNSQCNTPPTSSTHSPPRLHHRHSSSDSHSPPLHCTPPSPMYILPSTQVPLHPPSSSEAPSSSPSMSPATSSIPPQQLHVSPDSQGENNS